MVPPGPARCALPGAHRELTLSSASNRLVDEALRMHEHPLIAFKEAQTADPVLRAVSDPEIFDAGVRDGRVIVTNNVTDLESLRGAREAAGGPVPCLIYTSDVTFPRTRAYVSHLSAALAAAAMDGKKPSTNGLSM
jgi:hypothetical protein